MKLNKSERRGVNRKKEEKSIENRYELQRRGNGVFLSEMVAST